MLRGKIKSLRWKINRLSKMSFKEIIYRITFLLKAYKDKILINCKEYFDSGKDIDIDFEKISSLSNFNNQIIDKKFRLEIDNIISESENIIKNRFNIFGNLIEYEAEIDWHYDKVNERRWPSVFWTNINIRDGLEGQGPKFVWETNRFYFLPILAIAYRYSGKKKYSDKMFHFINDWYNKNKYPFGVNWTSCIELSVRLINLIFSLSFLDQNDCDSSQKDLINRFVFLHANHIYRYPSKYSSCNNHTLAEALALVSAGTYFKKLRNAGSWFKYGKATIEKEIERQINEDGGSAESSVSYLSLVYDIALMYKIICTKEKIVYSTIVDKRLDASGDLISALLDKKGNIPNIGDQDDSLLLKLSCNQKQNFNSIANTHSYLYKNCQDRLQIKNDFKNYILFGDNYIDVCNNDTIREDKIFNKYYRDSGYIIIKNFYNDKEILICGNCTEMGLPPLYAHGHLDALSFTLSIDGKQFFIDPGTYLYHSGGRWRKYFRSNIAHNTIRIDSLDFSDQPGDFMYGVDYKIDNADLLENNNEIKWIASHKAYEKIIGTIHKRIFIYNKRNARFIIGDIITKRDNSVFKVEQFFHFHPDVELEIDGNRLVLKRDDILVDFVLDNSLKLKKYYGDREFPSGWYSENFGKIQKTNTILAYGSFKDKKEFLSEGVVR